MGRLLLVRHGQASWGAADYDVLSELGQRQGKLLGAEFAERGIVADTVVMGGLRRHADTAAACAAAAGWSATPTIDPDWDEYDHVEMLDKVAPPHDGELDQREFQEWIEAGALRWTSGAEDYTESFATFTARVWSALDRLPREGTTVVFTSGGPISWLAAALLTEGAARVDLWHRLNPVCANSGVTRIVTGRRGTTLVSFNEHTHLDGVDGALSYR